ncbi:MAG: hypothetical protein J1F35_06680 [Erysipelotrichales bacterium]|nr:hypothetical protein [Erysipelotrichales bacterium]
MTKYLTILNFNIGEVNIYEIDENQYDFYMEDEEAFVREVIGLNYDEVCTMISDEEPFITKEKLITKIKNYSHSQAFKWYRKQVKQLNNLLKANEDLKSIRRDRVRELKKSPGYDPSKLDEIYYLGKFINRNLVDIKVLNDMCKILKHKVIQANKKLNKKR